MAKENENTAEQADLEKQVADLRKDIAAIASTLSDLGSKKLNEAKDRAQTMYENARAQGDEALHEACDKLSQTQDSMCACVREKPMASLAIAAGIGFVLGQILRR
ncbi:YqjD family protein [Bartonella sp. HY406]|uniref:DUF883 family protein n=1 Tax=Bartonella sp. HY406 TaxID=2979331 RepID=UPI0021C7B515|nr:DUF883 domain-containing protein [Bartonella sp. HY406]UXN03086.1 DUF883 domain-containing protein [Bartonella sp. HY406]